MEKLTKASNRSGKRDLAKGEEGKQSFQRKAKMFANAMDYILCEGERGVRSGANIMHRETCVTVTLKSRDHKGISTGVMNDNTV